MEYSEIIKAITEGQAELAMELCKKALAQGYPAVCLLEKGLIAGMNKVADKFRDQKVMVPEVLMSTRAMHAGLSMIQPFLTGKSKGSQGKIVLGTVAGDLHDIGISLVKIMIMSTGARIIDLGVDVTPKRFASAVRKEDPDILMMSSLLTTTMPVMKQVIEELDDFGLRKGLKIIVGGAPVEPVFARAIGADHYFESAPDVKKFLDENLSKIVGKRKLAF